MRPIVRSIVKTTVIVAAGGFLLLLAVQCPPWSLKGVIARRAGCKANLWGIYQALQERGIPLVEQRTKQIGEVIIELNLTCREGSDLRGRVAGYYLEISDGKCIITEEPGNHPARERFMAGSIPEERFEIDAAGKFASVMGESR